jgi:hypothetical protein
MRVALLLLFFFCQVAMSQDAQVPITMPIQTKTEALKAFVTKKKFLPENHYPGAPNELVRSRFEGLINSLANNLVPFADKPDPKAKLMEAFEEAYPAFEHADTEERERAVGYLEELMGILGVESSDGLLNKLLYGFNPLQSADARNAEALAEMNQDERNLAAKLESLTAQNAQAFLLEALGKPTILGNTHIWMRESNPAYSISLALEPKAIIVWMVQGRFLYTKQM